jgi:hypothetical protein
MWGDLRLLTDQNAVGVDEAEPRRPNLGVRVSKQLEGVGAAPALVRGGKERAQVG